MIQRFIELGEGYSDIYELLEIAKSNQHRLQHLIAIHTELNEKAVCSLIVVLEPTKQGDFQPLYICREGIPSPKEKENKRFDLFMELANQVDKTVIQFDVKPSTVYAEKELYYQHLISILRLNHYISPMK